MLQVNDCAYVESGRLHLILESFTNLLEADFTNLEKEVTKCAGQLPRVIKAPVSSSTDDKLEDFPDLVPATVTEEE